MTRTLRLTLPASLLLLACTAEASLILIPNSAISGNARAATFDVGDTQGLPYSESGATFESFSGLFASVLSVNNFLAMAGDGTLVVTFDTPVLRSGLFFFNSFGGTQELSAAVFADTAGTTQTGEISLGTFFPEGSGQVNSGTVAFESDAPFSRLHLTVTNLTPGPAPASYFIDDFRFEGAIPEPATFVLLAAPVAGLLLSGWRRASRKQE
jgi:hypothetical protein